MPRSFARVSALVLLTLGSAGVAHAQRPNARPEAEEAKTGKKQPPGNPGHPDNPGNPGGNAGGGPAATPATPAAAKYRVTLTGFRVNHETWDTPLETDGKGDEIRLTASVQLLGANGEAVGAPHTLQTPTYGDVNTFPKRIQAGSRSAKGGLKSGDTFPATGNPAMRQEEPRADRLPLLLWQGELKAGQNAVAIAPTVWEVDSGDVLTAPLAGLLSSGLGAAKVVQTVGPIAALIPGIGIFAKSSGAVAEGVAARLEQASDRIGNRPVGIIPSGTSSQYAPQVVILTNAIADAVIAGQAHAYSPGVIEVRYRDPAKLQGDYSLFLQVERIP